jgi:hypothetical protein
MQLVALTLDDRVLHVATVDGETRLRADGTSVGRRSCFERLDLGHDRVALRLVDGGYLTHAPDRAQSFGLYLGEELTPCAAFEEVLWPDGRVSLRSCQLTYVHADVDTGSVTSCRTVAGEGTRFRYEAVPLGAVPQQQRRTTPVGPVRQSHPARLR